MNIRSEAEPYPQSLCDNKWRKIRRISSTSNRYKLNLVQLLTKMSLINQFHFPRIQFSQKIRFQKTINHVSTYHSISL